MSRVVVVKRADDLRASEYLVGTDDHIAIKTITDIPGLRISVELWNNAKYLFWPDELVATWRYSE
jgi:hypothetical protein